MGRGGNTITNLDFLVLDRSICYIFICNIEPYILFPAPYIRIADLHSFHADPDQAFIKTFWSESGSEFGSGSGFSNSLE
jgi:hypothetical protein